MPLNKLGPARTRSSYLAAIVIILALTTDPVVAATLTVTNTNDSGAHGSVYALN